MKEKPVNYNVKQHDAEIALIERARKQEAIDIRRSEIFEELQKPNVTPLTREALIAQLHHLALAEGKTDRIIVGGVIRNEIG